MNYVEKLMDGVQSLMKVNLATLSGAVDILVAPQEDGSLSCTSWHVRFGKLQLLNTSEKKIKIYVNDQRVRGMNMRLGAAGEAYFVIETLEKPPPEFEATAEPLGHESDEEASELDFTKDYRAMHDDWVDNEISESNLNDSIEMKDSNAWDSNHQNQRNQRDYDTILDNSETNNDHSKARQTNFRNLNENFEQNETTSPGDATPPIRHSFDGLRIQQDTIYDFKPNQTAMSRSSDGLMRSLHDQNISTSPSPSTPPLTSTTPTLSDHLMIQSNNSNSGNLTPQNHSKTDNSLKNVSSQIVASNSSSSISTTTSHNSNTPQTNTSTKKSWGLNSIFGFLGKNKQDSETGNSSSQNTENVQLTNSNVDKLNYEDANYSRAINATSESNMKRDYSQTSYITTELSGDPIYSGNDDMSPIYHQEDQNYGLSEKQGLESSSEEVSFSNTRASQSSSLPTNLSNHWGPSPLLKDTGSFENIPHSDSHSDDGFNQISSGSNRQRSNSYKQSSSYNNDDDSLFTTSRAADDGSGVIFIGQKKSSIRPASSSSSVNISVDRPSSASPSVSQSSERTYTTNNNNNASNNQNNNNHHNHHNHHHRHNTHQGHASDRPGQRYISRSRSMDKSELKYHSRELASSYESPMASYEDNMVFDMDEDDYRTSSRANGSTISGSKRPKSNSSILPNHESRALFNDESIIQSEKSYLSKEDMMKMRLLKNYDIEISKCGANAVLNPDFASSALEIFRTHSISFKDLSSDPNILFGNEIVFRIQGQFYPFSIAAPLIFSILAFNKPLSQDVIEKQLVQWKSKNVSQKSWGRWFGWRSKNNENETSKNNSFANKKNETPTKSKHQKYPSSSSQDELYFDNLNDEGSLSSSYKAIKTENASKLNNDQTSSSTKHRPRSSSRKATTSTPDGVLIISNDTSTEQQAINSVSKTPQKSKLSTSSSAAEEHSSMEKDGLSSQLNHGHQNVTSNGSEGTNQQVYYVRSLKPTSDQLKRLNLKHGPNKVVFCVDSRLQGVQEVTCTIYLWDRSVKIVISDIDGTITKSDVLGQIFPVFGKDWSHSGVAALFNSIKANGYEILYLTARAIGASKITKDFLTKLEQDSVRLPDGPVFMSPDRLLHSLNREVILRKPEKFKIHCLTEIKELFAGKNSVGAGPFYAGFGNRHTDALSYIAVGIPAGKTFTIDPSGEITGHSKSIQRTYTKINELAEQMFPPYDGGNQSSGSSTSSKKRTEKSQSEQWNDFQYWETRPTDGYSLDELEKELLK